MKSLIVDNLNVNLQGSSILRDLSFSLEAGGISVILGRSGTGKTTLLRAINRLNEHDNVCQNSGEIFLNLDGAMLPLYAQSSYGKNAPLPSLDSLRKRVAMLFQNPNILPMSIEQNILFPLQYHEKLSGMALECVLKELLEKVELWEDVKNRLKSPASELSGGQQQRLCLARALALKPDYLLLDEPTASLDVATTKSIEKLILTMSESKHCIIVCHSVEQALRLGDRFVLLDTKGSVTVKNKGELSEEDIRICFEKISIDES